MSANETLVVIAAVFALCLFAVVLAMLLEREQHRHHLGRLGLFEPEMVAAQARRAMDEINYAAFVAMAESSVRAQHETAQYTTAHLKPEAVHDV